MRRREFIGIAGGVAVWPLAARAQQKPMPVIGFLRSTSPGNSESLLTAFRQGLIASDYVEGRNVAIEYRWAEDQISRLPALAADLVQLHVDVIVANQPSVQAAKAATSEIPIVFVIGGDPVQLGFVTSLNRPVGNVTGLTFLTGALEAKKVQILHELIPQATRMAAFVNPNNPDWQNQSEEIQKAAQAMQLQVQIIRAASEGELELGFARIAEGQAGAIVVTGDAFFRSQRDRLLAFAARHALPISGFATAGGLFDYDPSITAAYHRASIYVVRILKGAKPADLPVEQSTKVELVINLKTAKALGLTVPQSLLARADEVIE
jgi:putative ABC transport system substrate-binding protein